MSSTEVAPCTPIIQNSVPIRYDARVVVKPSAPHRVPRLPVQILYLIAQALPQPRWIFNLARADKESWAYLQPALYECEVTYEARIAHVLPYSGGASSYTLQEYYGFDVQRAADSARNDPHDWHWDSDSDTDGDSDNDIDSGENNAEINLARRASYTGCKQGSATGQCDQCERRIDIDRRVFYGLLPKDLLETNRPGLTALHWAAIRGASALPVALKALRSAQTHQPSYIDGVGLTERMYRRDPRYDNVRNHIPADLPPPLFFAVAHGNVAVCKALIEAGCDVNILQGQAVCGEPSHWKMSFKIHKKCMRLKRRFDFALKCVCQWETEPECFNDIDAPGCQMAGHVAIRYNQAEMLTVLLQNGLDVHLGLHPLIREAVVEGNLPFVKTLLDHDPSLIHSRQLSDTNRWNELPWWKQTLIHIVPFMRQKPGSEDVRNGRLREMVAFLLERGVGLDESDSSGITALKAALIYAQNTELNDTAVFTALHAAEVLVTMGAVWNRPSFTGARRYGILGLCVDRTVTRYDGWYGVYPSLPELDGLWEWEALDECKALYRETRKGWGRLVKTIIGKATVSMSQDISTAERTAIRESISTAFESLGRYFREEPSYHNYDGPWAVEAVGKLLLSTGITPNDEEMKRWKGVTLFRSVEGLSADGDRSQWRFLLRGLATEPGTERRREHGSVRQGSGRQGQRRRARRGRSSARR